MYTCNVQTESVAENIAPMAGNRKGKKRIKLVQNSTKHYTITKDNSEMGICTKQISNIKVTNIHKLE
jgi:hypothetical protein